MPSPWKATSRYDTVDAAPASTHLVLSESDRRTIERVAEADYPHEACGLMVGLVTDGRVEVRRVVVARNLNEERAHDRYLLDPQAFITTDAEARGEGLEIVGIWHSHPDSPARPSITDLETAWEGYSYAIVALDQGKAVDLQSYRLDGDRFRYEPVAGNPRGLPELLSASDRRSDP